MTITAIYFKDEDFTHVKIGPLSPTPDHLIINGKVLRYNEPHTDYTVEGKDVVVKVAHKKTDVSHYVNRENKDEISCQEYRSRLKSFKDEEGNFNDLESEYMYKKTKELYVPVNFSFYEYEEVPVVFEEAELTPDKYSCCSGRVFKREDGEDLKGHFIFYFNRWAFANDLITRLMDEYGIPRLYSRNEAKGLSEYYILHDETGEYCWLELCGNEYFLRYEEVFGRGKPHTEQIYYCTYEGVRKVEDDLEKWLRERIEQQLDRVRTIIVKKSSIASMKGKLLDLAKKIDNNKMNRRQIIWELQSIARDIDQLSKL